MVCAITPEQLLGWFLFMRRRFTKEEVYREFDRLDRLGCMVGDKEAIDDLLLMLKVEGLIEVRGNEIVSKWTKMPEELSEALEVVERARRKAEKDIW